MVRILVFAGSAREKSLNKKLARVAANRARTTGAEVTFADLRDYPMPLYDGDLEDGDGPPAMVGTFRELLRAHDGFVVVCPEYNSSITPLLKNVIDWASRPAPNDSPIAVFGGKTATLLSASPGALGGLRGLVHVRSILGSIGVHVMPTQLAVPHATQAFTDDESKLADEQTDGRLSQAIRELIRVTTQLTS